ncbi:O-antigen biosynthesis protein RfbC [Planktothrix tepida]|uniref:Glycosyl transferase, family 2 n=1 Tax=Planktothrix tepida PCC 9214 TaxID=671072 RepID=A0A1J1LG65_9CYAN|nr:glycosyltransferase [Planktothrix tepida]CAD5929182.1 O-antigen biosynthesis protein RfbC [Planktothrix tepida]CUR31464.1 Glycosyl transferase, family 2 [Planktothrix tepida PCC 9214]
MQLEITKYLQIAEYYYFKNQWKQAISYYRCALELNPNLPGIHQKIGDILQQQAASERSHLLNLYQQKIQQNPDNLQTYYQALEISPKDADLYLGLAKALTRQGRFDQAQLAYQKVLQLQPNHPQLQNFNSIQNQTLNPNLISQVNSSLQLDQAKQAVDSLNQIALDSFLNTGSQLNFPRVENPEISIIIILYNRAELTLSCLTSLIRNSFQSFELILVDNNSTDTTRQLLKQINGAKIILNEQNLHYLLACNQASKIAQGNYLLFLNNDTQILGDSISSAFNTIKSSKDIGAVGGKLILPDGTLQEAGSIIWQDGTCLGYGRGDSPNAPQYLFQRSVDYCSAAFLLTPRDLFLQLGGFDEDYQPAYYEETDYCIRLQKIGKKIIYDPNVNILHYEFASSSHTGSSDHAIALMEKNQQLLKQKHKDWFKSQYPCDLKNLIFARTQAREKQKRLLYIDDRIPHPWVGSGYTRSHSILSHLVKLGYSITFYPGDLRYLEDWSTIYADIPQTVEIMRGYGLVMLEDFLRERQGYYDLVFVSRPHNIKHLNSILVKENFLNSAKIIYDAEAIFSIRDYEYKRLNKINFTEEERQKAITEEIKLAKNSHHIITVSPQEKQQFIQQGYTNLSILGHTFSPYPTPKPFAERQNLIFVGSIYELESPNADSLLWLTHEIFPLIQNQLDQTIELIIIGNNTVEEIKQKINNLNNSSIKLLGKVDDLIPFYNQARLFVAPTRYAAGIPHKVHEAAAYGLPIVTTSLIAQQLGWNAEIELLVADDPVNFAQQCVKLYQDSNLWNKLRKNALNRVEIECSATVFSEKLDSILNLF